MEGEELRRTARALEGRLAAASESATPEALADMKRYVALLHQASGRPTRYTFKLELADGRWDVAEQLLGALPRVGDVLAFDDGGRWKVHRTQLVAPRPRGKPPREFFVCAPAA